MIRAMIVEDEQHAREELSVLLAEAGDFELVGCCGNSLEALRDINQLQPDLLFLDIQMPGLSGFDLLRMIDEDIMPHVIFVTAYDQYALKAFEEKTLDYLVKPIDPQHLQRAIAKASRTIQAGNPPALPKPGRLNRIPCHFINRVKLIAPGDVDHVYSDVAGIHVVTEVGDFFTELTLKTIECRTQLVQCHKQFLVNPHCIDEIRSLENGLAEIRTTGGFDLPVSRRFHRLLKCRLGI